MSALTDAITAMTTAITEYGAAVQTEIGERAKSSTLGTMSTHNLSTGSAAPSGGEDGDVYFQTA